MKFLLDQGAPFRAAALLREEGIEASHPSEVNVATSADSDIISWCVEHDAIVLTLDADFHALIALSRRTAPSAIRFRVQSSKELTSRASFWASLARTHES